MLAQHRQVTRAALRTYPDGALRGRVSVRPERAGRRRQHRHGWRHLAMTRAARGVKAWVLHWEVRPGGPAPIAQDGEVVAILSSRMGVEKVKEVLERLYMQRAFSLAELVMFRRSGSGPYPVHSNVYVHGIEVSGLGYECGHNPVLIARLAERVRAISEDVIEWEEVGPLHASWHCAIHHLPPCADADKPPSRRRVRSRCVTTEP
jgi:hypothetical protein